MSNKQFISNLSATYADIRKLDVKKINLKGKNILEYIKENSTVILDERGTLANDELDIWNSYVTKDENGNVIINRSAKPHVHGVKMGEIQVNYEGITRSQLETLNTAVKVIDNEVLGANDEHIMYWQTDGMTDGYMIYAYNNDISEFKSDLSSLKDGSAMFNSSSISSFSSDLSSLKDGSWMFCFCPNLTSFSSDLSSLTDGNEMFKQCRNLESFSSDLSSLTSGNNMFNYCINLSQFTSDLSSLTNGEYMFTSCDNLTAFSSDLPNLTNGGYMFNSCSALTSFSSDMSSLTNGFCMFHLCGNLTTFTSDLPSLTNGNNMFYQTNLSEFTSDLSSLTNGNSMFWFCDTLTSFDSALPSLESGYNMFKRCILDAQSVANIIHFIPQRDAKPTQPGADGVIYIGVGITNTDAAKQAFAEECDCDNWEGLNKEFDDKNWSVYWEFNGSASYSLRDPRPSTAVFARLEEVIMPTEEEITEAKEKGERIEMPHYQYTSQDGTKFYNIHWYHDSNTNNEGYDYFESLEEAISAYSVISKA